MSKNDLSTSHCKQRFKGVENFLRRVAFNLGNTPSQTEVKIISCIPIDVSDLQQKIISLEKQLNEATAIKSNTVGENRENNTACVAALCTTNFSKMTNNGVTCNEMDFEQQAIPQKELSNATLRTPSRQTSTFPCTQKAGPSTKSNCYCYFNTSSSRRIRTDCSSQPLMICEPQKEERRNFFRKKKKLPKKKKVNTQFVYYAQTSNTPFTDTDRWNVLDEMETKTDGMSRSYLADMIRKQYKPKKLGGNISDLSEYSSPVCRDGPPECNRPCPYESEACSCCHGEFHNIDHQKPKTFNDILSYSNVVNSGNAYYDSSLYDLVPVKEKPVKVKKDIEIPVKTETKPKVNFMSWPDDIRAVSRFRPYIVNYHTVSPIRNSSIENMQKKQKIKNTVVDRMVAKRKRVNNFGKQLDVASSKSCCIEFGKVYAKKSQNRPKISKDFQIPKPQHKNAECLTTTIQNSDCQTVTSKVEVKKPEGKTEATLNQIKSILQSVLTEVKTNNQLKSISDVKPKRDAVVQKGPSQSNLQGSTFLNSFTYSPYNMNPYIISGSQQMNPSHFCYPQANLKYLQNFPLLIQSGHHLCNSCYRNNSHVKPVYTKQATTTSTNTDEVTDRAKETQKLIKEIYKSMALTTDLPNKDTSYSDYEYLQSVPKFESERTKEVDEEKIKKVVRAISEVLLMKNRQTDTSSKFTSNAVSTKSQYISTDTERPNKLVEMLIQKNKKDSVSVNTAIEIQTPPEETDIGTASRSDTSDSDVESEVSYDPDELPQENQKKEKRSLLSKMFKSMFKPKEKPKKADMDIESESESTSDSDDYQTVYSQKSDKQRYRTRAVNLSKIKTHSKISNSKQCYRDRSPAKRRSPYMEQEYRRVWTEGIMFDKKGKMYSSGRPYSKETTPRKHVYYQNYEARPVVVDAGGPYSGRQINHMVRNPYTQGEGSPAKKRNNFINKAESKGTKGLEWLKKHKMGIHCGEQWKKLILEG